MSTQRKPQVVVPKPEFRESVRALYMEALAGVGVEVEPQAIVVHIDSSATVNVTLEQYERLPAIKGVMLLSDLSKKGNVKLVIPQAIEYLRSNRPTLTDEERAARATSSSTPMTPERKAELERRRLVKEQLADMLSDLWDVEMGKPDDDDIEDDD